MKVFILVISCLVSSFAFPSQKTQFPLKQIPLKDIDSRIVNGEDARDGQYPWAALLIINGNVLCGSSLISDEWVLTAAHCALAGPTYQVSVGSVLINGDDSNRIRVDSSESYVHEEYNPDVTGLNNDVAVIRIPRVPINDNIRPIALASDNIGGDVEVTAIGWGGISEGGPISETLRFTSLVTMTNDECSRTFVIFDGTLCTRSPQENPIHSTCGGDSGSALVRDASSNPVQVGVTSFISGFGCEANYPQGFSRVSYFRDWVRGKTGV